MSPRGYIPGREPPPGEREHGCIFNLALMAFLLSGAWWGTLVLAYFTHAHIHLP